MNKELFVDRFNNNIVVCFDKNGNKINIKRNQISGNLIEGSVIVRIKKNSYKVDEIKTEREKSNMFKLQNEIFNNRNN